ncbi:MAG: hypothetical protein KDA64_16260 [Rhodospirillaceae bacterium]|nr:hypothetical protein [Rhodospirillaceae bacterium]
MTIELVHTFLVHPSKGRNDRPEINGTRLPLSGSIFDLLAAVYDRSEQECDIPIIFRHTTSGSQQNDCRDLIIEHLRDRKLSSAKLLAERLSKSTDGRSGLGLLFVIVGSSGLNKKVVVSRFPTDSAIFVEENTSTFNVRFLEQVFMKNKASYKAVVYQGASMLGDFWTGLAIDRQITGASVQTSDYWISDFLMSDFATTPAAGSSRLGIALRDAVKKAPIEVKAELVAAGKLASGLAGETISIDSFADRFGLSAAATAALKSGQKNSRTTRATFKLDVSILRNYIAYQSVQLDNGAVLTAETSDFENVFRVEQSETDQEIVEFSTRGKIVDEKFRRSP